MIADQYEILKFDKGTILLVDDQPDQIDIIHSILERDFIVKVSIRGELALQICSAGGIDLVLLDVMMPGMNGYEVCRQLKSNPATREIPVIFLTSMDSQSDEAEGLGLGAEDFIRKPSSSIVVITRCRNTIDHHRSKQELYLLNKKLQQNLIVRETVEQLSKHDLKGPLTGIIGIPQILIMADNITEEQKSILRLIEKNGYAMLDMINRSLDMFKMEIGSYQFSPEVFDLFEVLEAVVVDLRRLASAKCVMINISCAGWNPDQHGPFMVIGEKMLCYPTFYNLILNAIEASKNKCDISIHFSHDNSEISVRITNTGEVPLTIRDNFFDKYVTSGKKYGTGLGTYSAWLSIKTQNGKITLDTSQSCKTSVIVTLPFSEFHKRHVTNRNGI
ncbi:MAG: response regulator [Magnetococcales bacterium]|nr:response regulator [Magnetococcales bacterium]HIJ82797.1 response regulator [Magnetococcales bacterium]